MKWRDLSRGVAARRSFPNFQLLEREALSRKFNGSFFDLFTQPRRDDRARFLNSEESPIPAPRPAMMYYFSPWKRGTFNKYS
jgi:hypothetical protein